MSTNLPLAISHRRTRFILVNDRLPYTDERCAMCGGFVDKGYVRDSQHAPYLLRHAVFRGSGVFVE